MNVSVFPMLSSYFEGLIQNGNHLFDWCRRSHKSRGERWYCNSGEMAASSSLRTSLV